MINILDKILGIIEFIPVLTIPISIFVLKILKMERTKENQDKINTILIGILKELRKYTNNYDKVKSEAVTILRERLNNKQINLINEKYESLTDYVEHHLYSVNGYNHDSVTS